MPAKRTTVTAATAATTTPASAKTSATPVAAKTGGATAAAVPVTPLPMPNTGTASGTPQGGGINVNASRPLEMFNGLTRLTPARDLTLGGRGPKDTNKKVFAPNLNAVRNKNVNVKTSKDFTQSRGRRGGRGASTGATRGGGGGRGGGNSSLIQTTGVFSEGVGALQVRKSSGNGTAYAREDVSVTSRKRKDEKGSQLSVKELLGESDDSDDAGGNDPGSMSDHDGDKTELVFKPIALKEGLWHNEKPVVKEEIPTSMSTNQQDSLAIAQHLKNLHVTAHDAIFEEPPPQFGRYPRSIGAFLDGISSQMFVMQLPDVLPCVTDDADDNIDGQKAPSSSSSSSAAAAANAAAIKEEGGSAASGPIISIDQPSSPIAGAVSQTKLTVLNQLEEGQIGKIIRYRSGRVKLILGDTHFDLDMGLESGFLQEIMSISTNREQRSGDMINLGPVQAKLKATPDWVHLFEQQEAIRKSTAATNSTTTAITTTLTTNTTTT